MPANKAGDPGLKPGPNENFSLKLTTQNSVVYVQKQAHPGDGTKQAEQDATWYSKLGGFVVIDQLSLS